MRRLGPAALLCAACATASAAREDQAGAAALAAGQPQAAYDHFRRALTAQPDDLEAYRQEVEAARAIGKLDLLTAGARAEAARDPRRAAAHYRLGLCLFAHTDGEREGLAELAEAARLDPGAPELALRLGAALLEAERPGEALALLRRAA